MAVPASETQESSTTPDNHESVTQFDSLRELLLAKEKQQLEALEQRNLDAEQQIHLLQDQLATLQQMLTLVQDEAESQRLRANDLQSQIDQLQTAIKVESEAMIPRLIQKMSHIITETIRNSRDEMAAALGPVMSEAIRVQIRDSRKSMVEALYPIILETVQRAIAAFARELQHNIDTRLRSTFQIREIGRTVRARLRGVSPSELALRDALPFAVQEMFLVQHESGLLMAHTTSQPDEASDSDLISGMLTAIRDFARDSFGDGDESDELDEIQYGDERIIIQSGQFAYLATVVTGVEPAGFRTRIREFLSNLHLNYSHKLRDYEGDPSDLPEEIPAEFADFGKVIQEPETAVSRPISRAERRVLVWGGLVGIILIAFACFYLQFTLALWPMAFGDPTPTNTPMPTAVPIVIVESPTPLPTETATTTPLPTSTPTHTPSPTPTNKPTLTPIPTNPPTSTPIPPTKTPFASFTNAPVWVRPLPDRAVSARQLVEANTAVSVQAQYNGWVEIVWLDGGEQSGWVPLSWITLSEPIPDDLITPVILDASVDIATLESEG